MELGKKRARRDDNLAGDSGQPVQCDCCDIFIPGDKDHIQNNPCQHIICFMCVVKSNMKRAANPAYFCCQCQVENCTQTFTTSCQYFNRGIPGKIILSMVELSADDIPRILSFLDLKEIMQKRRVSKKWNEAVKNTIVAPTDFRVDSVERYIAMTVMTRAMPNLQQLEIGYLEHRHKYSDGEDPNEWLAGRTATWTTHDIEIISNFSKLRNLRIKGAELNGRYPVLFNSFPMLQKLSIIGCPYLKWDLEMLTGFPLLKELYCHNNRGLRGNINSLRVLKETLEKVGIFSCENIQGNFMDLADFPRLRELFLEDTAVTGDIRDIGESDFPSLEELQLPKAVYGGYCYEFRRISDGPEVIRAVYLLKKHHPALRMKYWFGFLSEDSPDRYDRADDDDDTPPFCIRFVEAGFRVGYRWETHGDNPCEVNWLDPEPDSGSSDYEEYIKRLRQIDDEVTTYRGFYQPPTEEEYNRLWERNTGENDE